MSGAEGEARGTPREPGEDEDADASAPEVAPDGAPARATESTRFAHASEAEMARILDFYAVRWEYEPTTFPILWNLDGDVVESFAPDFYLPELEVFLEMTTLKQRLVRKKNRKLRRLRELYPDVRIKLFYARDFRAMMLKYGRFGLTESLSGTPGQVVPERAAVEVMEPAGTAGPEAAPLAGEPAPELPSVLVQEAVLPTGAARPRPVRAAAARSSSRSRAGRRRRSGAVETNPIREREAGA